MGNCYCSDHRAMVKVGVYNMANYEITDTHNQDTKLLKCSDLINIPTKYKYKNYFASCIGLF